MRESTNSDPELIVADCRYAACETGLAKGKARRASRTLNDTAAYSGYEITPFGVKVDIGDHTQGKCLGLECLALTGPNPGIAVKLRDRPTLYSGTANAYDAENQMTSFGSTLKCGYRADWLRAWKQAASGVKTYFLYIGADVIGEFNSAGIYSVNRTYGPDGLAGIQAAGTSTAVAYDIQGNLVHTTVPATGTNPSETSLTGFNAYGGVYGPALTSNGPVGFNAQSGYYYDIETGLYHCGLREYDPNTGRWLQRDPIGFDGGINLYGYANGQPVGMTDPDGDSVVKVISYRVFSLGWHRGILVEDNMGHKRSYSFAGGPENTGFHGFGFLKSMSGPWERGTQDFNKYRMNSRVSSGEVRVITLVDDDSPFEGWVKRFTEIEREIAKHPKQDYGPMPSDFHLWGGKTANSNVWCHYLLDKAGLMSSYRRAVRKIPGGDLPYAPGWGMGIPYNDAPK